MKQRLIISGTLILAALLICQPGARGNAQIISNAKPRLNPAAQVQNPHAQKSQPQYSGGNTAWTMIGPTSVTSLSYGAVSGRITSLALDPSDTTGNKLFVGTTGGGIWYSTNAASSIIGNITFTPLTDDLSVMLTGSLTSLSIGALSVQPGGTGVVLAGTGDPNDAFDSYYGVGILNSSSDGSSWTLITHSSDLQQGYSDQDYSFSGEAIAGFAWSTTNPQTVVAAVSQAYKGYLDSATIPGNSYEGLYYSPDAGNTWLLSTINDSAGNTVQGPLAVFAGPDGNAATSVVWNPVRKLFIAAIRYHGYYSSPDGITWTRLANGGTLFLDEIATMGLDTQSKILRVLQDKRFMHLGGIQEIQVDVRILAATNVDLRQAVRDGHFREDLFYRLNVITVDLPPLRYAAETFRLTSAFW